MSGTTSEPFNIVVDRWVDKAKANALAVFAGTVFDIVARLKALTPVRTGYLRAHWQVTTGDDVSPITSQNTSDGLNFALTDLKLGVRAVITNDAPYARRVNYGFVGPDSRGRHYHQHGLHMVEQVITEIPQIVKNVVLRVQTGQGGDSGDGSTP